MSLKATAPSGTLLIIRHRILEGSLQWVLCRNHNSQSNIHQFDENIIGLPVAMGIRLTLPLLEVSFHRFLFLTIFISLHVHESASVSPTAAGSAQTLSTNDWSSIRAIIGRVKNTHVGTVATPTTASSSNVMDCGLITPEKI